MMQEKCTALLIALDVLGLTQAALAKIAARSDERRRRDLVSQRRALAMQTAKVAELGDAIFDALGDPVLRSEFRRLVSAARSKAAFHQADWSAVRVGEFDAEYRKSAREAGEAHLMLSRWLRRTIAEIVEG